MLLRDVGSTLWAVAGGSPANPTILLGSRSEGVEAGKEKEGRSREEGAERNVRLKGSWMG